MDSLTSADFQIYYFKITFLGEVGTTIRLGIRSSFADMGLSTNDSILGPLSFI